jgi:single-stranded-DNA-specific exonuclease
MGNEEPLFVALGLTLEAPPTPIKERHLRLRVRSASGRVSFSALGWRMADRVQHLNLAIGSTIDLAFRLRENEHPNFGGLELEIADLRLSARDRLSS